MRVICALFAVWVVVVSASVGALGAPGAAAVVPPPEKAVVLDLKWMSPPAIAPDTTSGSAFKLNDCIRLNSKPATNSTSFTWSLRYPVPSAAYPVVVMRYRASAIGFAEQPILQIEADQGGNLFTANVIAVSDLKQDGTVQEFRKTLAALPDGSNYVRFRFALPPAVSAMEILDLRFEAPADQPATNVPSPQTLDIAVVDEFNHAIADAEVRAGPLERSNWSASTKTTDTGEVTLSVTPAPAARNVAGAPVATLPIEISVTRAGYVSQYAPTMQLPLAGPLLIRMAKVQHQAARNQNQPGPDAAAAPTSIQYPNSGYYNNGSYWENPSNGWGGWGYGYWPGGMWVIVINNGGDHPWHHHDHDGNSLTPPVGAAPPKERFVPWKPQPLVPAPTQLVTPMPTQAVVPMPTQAVVPMPTEAVVPLPTAGMAPVPTPTQTVTPLPTDGTAANDPGDGAVVTPGRGARGVAGAPQNGDVYVGKPILRGGTKVNAWPVQPRTSTPAPVTSAPPRTTPIPQRTVVAPPPVSPIGDAVTPH